MEGQFSKGGVENGSVHTHVLVLANYILTYTVTNEETENIHRDISAIDRDL